MKRLCFKSLTTKYFSKKAEPLILISSYIYTEARSRIANMGLCGSKQQESTTSGNDMAGTRTVKTKTTTNVQNATTSSTTKTKSGKKSHKPAHSRGDIVGSSDETTEGKGKISPKEAARLAAEKRLQDSTKELTKGQLGKKLAEQKGLKT